MVNRTDLYFRKMNIIAVVSTCEYSELLSSTWERDNNITFAI